MFAVFFWVSSIILLAMTIWLIIFRFLNRDAESNLAMLYYGMLVGYEVLFEFPLQENWVYSGVVVGMLLRFEFLGGGMLGMIFWLERLILVYYAYTTLLIAINF
jgi:hypothetical protein